MDVRHLKLMAVLAHPDDESLGFGGVLARYADEGVETSLVTATRGQSGRFRGHVRDTPEHPGEKALAAIREVELHAADTRRWWPTVWKAVSCHESQVAAYAKLKELSEVGLIRSRGHVPKGGYDVPNGSNHTSAVTPAIQ